jgi:uncharacterized protein YfaS (alpha-2-macroglobulin family)
MSRVLPNAMVGQAFRKLGVQSDLLEADLPRMVALGLQKLYGYQHNDGGWGWWYDDSTDVNQTAYVLLGLTMTEQAGFAVDDGVLARGVAALNSLMLDADPRAQAYGAFALVMAGQPVSVTLTLSEALTLDLFSQASLAIAFDAVGDAVSATALLDSLREAAIQDTTTAYWEEEGEAVVYSRKVMGSNVRTTAMVADALVRLDPASPLLPKAVNWLMEQRQGQGWGDTQKTSFAILALTDYLLASQVQSAGAAYSVYLNDELWSEGSLDAAGSSYTLVVTYSTAISPSLLVAGDNKVLLALDVKGGVVGGQIYYAAVLDVQRVPGDSGVAALEIHERSIPVQREYRLHGSGEPQTRFQRGDLVEVRLTLDVPEESWYLVVDDPLPAGFEALNERLGTTSHVASLYADSVYNWERYGYNRKEVRDERVSFFITHLDPGEQTFTYLVRATTEGAFTALPTQVYPMYEPEVWSRSDAAFLEVGPQ